MISATRQEILRLLEPLSELTPDIRFGQLIAFLPMFLDSPTEISIGEIEDEQLLEALRTHLAGMMERQARIAGENGAVTSESLELSPEG